ncbi:MAG: ATPase, T2SS/T4P/T4SS family [Planctomycetota bacterium]|jgi:type II secretory ATPase GspE/PulE/Tfp pilus assembly ATPase PilB-like protein
MYPTDEILRPLPRDEDGTLTPESLLREANAARVLRLVISVAGERCRVVGFRADEPSREVLIGQEGGGLGRDLVRALQQAARLTPERPQRPVHGYLNLTVDGQPDAFELWVLPSLGGEEVVLERRTRSGPQRCLSELGLAPGDHARLRALLTASSGFLAITGEPGQGRSTVLHAMLEALADADQRVVSMARLISRPSRKLTYIRVPEGDPLPPEAWVAAALRLSPGVLGIDDMQDDAATTQALRAALGGALVVHVLSDVDAIAATRHLLALPLQRGAVAAVLLGVLAVRLVRKTCPGCAAPAELPIELRAVVSLLRSEAPTDASAETPNQFVVGTGCEACQHQGWHGVTPLFELVALNDQDRLQLVDAHGTDDLLSHMRRTRQLSIRDQAVRLAAQGAIPVSELARVL